ncbi:MAG: zinc metallopeptidase [Lachnospiraceae bacterium]|nr:zinc metallopeptidase [Lachnospiraceae bacterium]
MFWWDPTYILVIIGALISGIAALNVKSTFNKFSQYTTVNRMTGAQVAQKMLHDAGIYDVTIGRVSGSMTDYYAPNEKMLHLSETVYDSTSVAAVGVAAHECGHAIQHHENYAPLTLRNSIVPIVNIGSTLAWPLILLGIIFGMTGLARFGVILFSLMVIFQLITLPVEFNASSRALRVLSGSGILMEGEVGGARKVLNAAALTYVAALLSTILQLLRLVILTRGSRRD